VSHCEFIITIGSLNVLGIFGAALMKNKADVAIRVICAIVALSVLGPQPATAQEAKSGGKSNGSAAGIAEQLVQEQVEAYNRHDLDGFLNCYSPDIKLYDFPDKLVGSGLAGMRATYGRLFRETPDLKVAITERIAQGDTVIDHESGSGNGRKFSAIAIYRVKNGKIVGVWFVH
jgi:hypothetical protein